MFCIDQRYLGEKMHVLKDHLLSLQYERFKQLCSAKYLLAEIKSLTLYAVNQGYRDIHDTLLRVMGRQGLVAEIRTLTTYIYIYLSSDRLETYIITVKPKHNSLRR